jgi:hypothetical protein
MVSCERCHVGGNYAALSPTCISCHEADRVRAITSNVKYGAPHANWKACATCHNVNFFRPADPGGMYANRRESVCQ